MKALLAVCSLWFLATASPAQDLIIENVTIIDGTGGPSQPGMTVGISEGRFTYLQPTEVAHGLPGRRIDGTGQFLMPGLIDVHVHLHEPDDEGSVRERKAVAGLASFLLAGVTTIYEAGDDPDVLSRMRAGARAGTIASPAIYSTISHVTFPAGQGSDETGAVLVPAGAEGDGRLQAYFSSRRPDMVKIIFEDGGFGPQEVLPTFEPDDLQRIIRAANREGLRTTVHVSTERRAEDAIYAGADTLAHPVIAGPVSASFVRLAAAKGVPIATTMAVGDFRGRVVADPTFLEDPLYVASASPADIAQWQENGRGRWRESRWTAWRLDRVRVIQANLAMLHGAGAVLALGSDLGLGAFSHREMELLQDAGIGPSDIVRIATLNGARFLGIEEDVGSIEVGRRADALLLSADPTSDIRNARSIVAVIQSGRQLDRSTLPVAGTITRAAIAQ